MVKIVATKHGTIKTANGAEVKVDETFMTTASVLFDAVYVPGGKASIDALAQESDAVHFVNEAFKHCKAISATGEGVEFVKNETFAGKDENDKAVILGKTAKETAKPFAAAIAQHRNWERELAKKVPA
jgi:catalase